MNQDAGTKILFGLVFLGGPALYIVWRVLPYFLFYAVPFLAVGLLFGFLWNLACKAEPMSYRRMGFLFPLSALLLLFTVGFPVASCQIPLTSAQLQSPWLFEAFNNLKSSLDAGLNWTWLSYYRQWLPFLLPPERYQAVLYDLSDLSWTLWLGLFTAAPVVFFILAARDETNAISRIENDYEKKLRQEESKVFGFKEALDRERAHTKSTIQEKDKEIEKLKNVVQAMTENDKAKPEDPTSGSENPPQGGGVFGTNFL